MKALFDTNVLLDFTNGVPASRAEILKYSDKAISIVTWIEVMVGADTGAEPALRAFLNQFFIVPVDPAVAEQAVLLRRQYRLKLPDAIIWATARTHNRLFVTRDTKDFPSDDPGIRVPYRLS